MPPEHSTLRGRMPNLASSEQELASIITIATLPDAMGVIPRRLTSPAEDNFLKLKRVRPCDIRVSRTLIETHADYFGALLKRAKHEREAYVAERSVAIFAGSGWPFG